ncbi:hypothetical protein FD754_023990 [Muntiacus muntjak]|uniref:Uncharacterized protein n=1 Tax=Muntiacus muntjak TaxID=9888 RepID=A0A5N3URY9_MUNMU|nr:hypothetical protein FD754_023990 [Muntiacus muntjak]
MVNRWGNSGNSKIRKITEKQESEKRIKMQQEVVEVLETNAKSKKCNPVEAGLYKFKARKLDSGVLYSGHVFPKKLAREATPHAFYFGFDFEMEKRIKQRKAKRPCPYHILLGVVGVPNKKEIPGTVPRSPVFVWKRTPNPPKKMRMRITLKPQISVRRTVEMRPFSFDSEVTHGKRGK